ncbi:aminoacyl-histidine dipeptidase [Aliagarivorans taiwanensis]|uniref:aminoacyl-histidine dipeptidase n=1 Tax=Aliagarivorans taiwanensis TaxID=561966 RepID=UPI0004200CDA|nr:aminoacyl-histidine dipeptidase [Aliagarivorans taiwanensis]
MSSISELKPNALWKFFDQICAIPHPSYHEQALIDWVVSWAKDQGLDVQLDEVSNVIIRKPATKGMEDREGVILQAHLDMVPQANSDTQHDFTADPIRPYIDGEWVTAEGTTLGADNGIGAASILAVLASDDIAHGPLEALLTINEEAGMDGAFGLKPGLLEGKLLLNTDSEQEGEVYMGCAGGGDTNVTFTADYIDASDAASFELVIKGLKGGHSGCDIHTGRANANKLLARLLAKLQQTDGLSLATIEGGSLRNAIPREAKAQIQLADVAAAKALLDSEIAAITAEYARVEDTLSIELVESAAPAQVMSPAMSDKLIASLNACINGVISMSQDIEGVVETSLNVGVIRTDESGNIKLQILVRSLVDSGRLMVESSLASLFKLAGAEVDHSGAYPGWKPDPNSALKTVIEQSYQQLFDKHPNTMVIHAGLECGLFKAAYPEWDMASFGPTIKFPHSPDEKVNIASVEKYWELMKAVLANTPAKG